MFFILLTKFYFKKKYYLKIQNMKLIIKYSYKLFVLNHTGLIYF